jgi:hypothetical protein
MEHLKIFVTPLLGVPRQEKRGVTAVKMKLRFLISSVLVIPVLMGTVLLAQDPGAPPSVGGRRGNATSAPHTFTPPTAAQLAAGQLTNIARYLKLDFLATSKLTGDATLVADIETEQTTRQKNATALSAARTALAADLAPGGNAADIVKQETIINTANSSNLAAGIAAAQTVLAELPHLGITVTSAQATGIAQMLIGGGFGPIGGFGPPPHSRAFPAGN